MDKFQIFEKVFQYRNDSIDNAKINNKVAVIEYRKSDLPLRKYSKKSPTFKTKIPVKRAAVGGMIGLQSSTASNRVPKTSATNSAHPPKRPKSTSRIIVSKGLNTPRTKLVRRFSLNDEARSGPTKQISERNVLLSSKINITISEQREYLPTDERNTGIFAKDLSVDIVHYEDGARTNLPKTPLNKKMDALSPFYRGDRIFKMSPKENGVSLTFSPHALPSDAQNSINFDAIDVKGTIRTAKQYMATGSYRASPLFKKADQWRRDGQKANLEDVGSGKPEERQQVENVGVFDEDTQEAGPKFEANLSTGRKRASRTRRSLRGDVSASVFDESTQEVPGVKVPAPTPDNVTPGTAKSATVVAMPRYAPRKCASIYRRAHSTSSADVPAAKSTPHSKSRFSTIGLAMGNTRKSSGHSAPKRVEVSSPDCQEMEQTATPPLSVQNTPEVSEWASFARSRSSIGMAMVSFRSKSRATRLQGNQVPIDSFAKSNSEESSPKAPVVSSRSSTRLSAQTPAQRFSSRSRSSSVAVGEMGTKGHSSGDSSLEWEVFESSPAVPVASRSSSRFSTVDKSKSSSSKVSNLVQTPAPRLSRSRSYIIDGDNFEKSIHPTEPVTPLGVSAPKSSTSRISKTAQTPASRLSKFRSSRTDGDTFDKSIGSTGKIYTPESSVTGGEMAGQELPIDGSLKDSSLASNPSPRISVSIRSSSSLSRVDKFEISNVSTASKPSASRVRRTRSRSSITNRDNLEKSFDSTEKVTALSLSASKSSISKISKMTQTPAPRLSRSRSSVTRGELTGRELRSKDGSRNSVSSLSSSRLSRIDKIETPALRLSRSISSIIGGNDFEKSDGGSPITAGEELNKRDEPSLQIMSVSSRSSSRLSPVDKFEKSAGSRPSKVSKTAQTPAPRVSRSRSESKASIISIPCDSYRKSTEIRSSNDSSLASDVNETTASLRSISARSFSSFRRNSKTDAKSRHDNNFGTEVSFTSTPLPKRHADETSEIINVTSVSDEAEKSAWKSFADVEDATPKSAVKTRRSVQSVYYPVTEDITPVTPEKCIADDDGAFKTPVNTPGLFESIKKSAMRSLKRGRESSAGGVLKAKRARIESPKNKTSVKDLFRGKSPKNDLGKVPQSPRNDYTDVAGVKKMFVTPKENKPPKDDLTKVPNLRPLMSPKAVPKTPRNDYSNIAGVKKMFATPKENKSPKNDLTKVPNLRPLMSPKVVSKTPRNDYSNVACVKKMFATPKENKSPRNDLTKVPNLRALMSPKAAAKSPRNDYSNVAGVKKMFATPKENKSPKNDLTKVPNLRRIMSPREQNGPANDLSEPYGVKRMFATPTKEPRNDLSDVEGVDRLFDDPFENLSGKKTLRAYRRSLSTTVKEPGEESERKTSADVPECSPWVEQWVKEQQAERRDPVSRRAVEKDPEVIVSPDRSTRSGRTRRARRENNNDVSDLAEKPARVLRTRRAAEPREKEPSKSTRKRKMVSESGTDTATTESNVPPVESSKLSAPKTKRSVPKIQESQTSNPAETTPDGPCRNTRRRQRQVKKDEVGEEQHSPAAPLQKQQARKKKVTDEEAIEAPKKSTRSRKKNEEHVKEVVEETEKPKPTKSKKTKTSIETGEGIDVNSPRETRSRKGTNRKYSQELYEIPKMKAAPMKKVHFEEEKIDKNAGIRRSKRKRV
ncbi:uncharacterized protein LOC132703983 isoform X2 [Cylas formicarius]|nr:uncharacterized protein LOC132703983 isoform X2 [Cylas formicarius]